MGFVYAVWLYRPDIQIHIQASRGSQRFIETHPDVEHVRMWQISAVLATHQAMMGISVNLENGAQKRTRTALRMSQNCENLDLGCSSEAPVGAPRMHFYQRIWVPSPKKLNDFNRCHLTQNASDFQQICMADQLQCDAFGAVATSSENGMLGSGPIKLLA